MEYYNNQKYKDALKHFQTSTKLSPNDRAELFIKVWKNNIVHINTKNNTQNYFNNKYNYQKSSPFSKPCTSSTNYSYQESVSSSNFSNAKNYRVII